jgi:hypothetical protein
MLKPLFFAILLCSGVLCLAQNKDTVSVEKPKISVKQRLNRDVFSLFKDSTELQSPRKAVLRSAIIPGWGQARNGKWWKVPLVYGGFVGIGLVYDFNQRFYKEFLGESQARSEGRKELEQYFNASTAVVVFPEPAVACTIKEPRFCLMCSKIASWYFDGIMIILYPIIRFSVVPIMHAWSLADHLRPSAH